MARAYGEAAVRVNPNGAEGHFTVAKALFGGGFLDKGNWEDAQRYLQKAVALKPQNIFHRLELGEVYVDVGKYSKAREQFTAIEPLPIADVLDHEYKQEAKQVLTDIKGEKDET